MRISTTLLCALGLLGCGGAASDITGSYATQITNGANSCPGDWTVGDTSSVTFAATQSGSDATLDVTGVSGFFLDAAIGSSTFNAKVSGDHVSGTLLGTKEQTQGNCQYTWKATLDGTLTGDALQGTVTYTPQTNGDADCKSMSVDGCSRTQSFSGSRAP